MAQRLSEQRQEAPCRQAPYLALSLPELGQASPGGGLSSSPFQGMGWCVKGTGGPCWRKAGEGREGKARI